jgi:hypothetical protein
MTVIPASERSERVPGPSDPLAPWVPVLRNASHRLTGMTGYMDSSHHTGT